MQDMAADMMRLADEWFEDPERKLKYGFQPGPSDRNHIALVALEITLALQIVRKFREGSTAGEPIELAREDILGRLTRTMWHQITTLSKIPDPGNLG